MAETPLAEVLSGLRLSILTGAAAKILGAGQMAGVADQRGLLESSLVEQVLGFWLGCVISDIGLGSTAAIKQNLEWLVSFREGHGLRFADTAVRLCWRELSAEIDAHLAGDESGGGFAAYREDVDALVARVFPVPEGVSDGV
jgi:hypothetical protein